MSKSLERVRTALQDTGLAVAIREMPAETRTAAQAADAVGCEIDQIAKSIILQAGDSERLWLFLTPGGRQANLDAARHLAGEPLGRADANAVRRVTGFAIGGVAPVGHRQPIGCFLDGRLLNFSEIWAAAGTPRHLFSISPLELVRICDAQVADFSA